MTDEDRGKRRMARAVAAAWGLFSAACLAFIGFGDLLEHELDSLVALHWAVTIVSGPLIVGLFGLDVAQLRTLAPPPRKED
jgi:hypothetical protein